MKDRIKEIRDVEKTLKGHRKEKSPFGVIKNILSRLISIVIKLIGNIGSIFIAFIFIVLSCITVMPILVYRKFLHKNNFFIKKSIYGYKGRKHSIYYLNFDNYILRNLGLFFSVFTRKLSIVGISIKQYENKNRVIGDSYLFNSRPGIFNLWYIRQSARVTHEGQFSTDWEYMYKKSVITDFLIILKSIPAAFYYFDFSLCKSKVNIFDMDFDNNTMDEAISRMDEAIKSKSPKKAYFVNPDCLNKIFEDEEYLNVLKKGDLVFPDGIGINIACKILKDPLKANINGTDMLPFICEMCAAKKYKIFLLGGKPGVADKMRANLEEKYSGLSIAGVQDGYFDRKTGNDSVIEAINNSKADILLVAFGAPLQEKWIEQNSLKLKPSIQMGVGGLFDFYSGNIKRAPKWMREVGMEWIFRIMQEPKRLWRRYVIGNPVFIYRVLKWKYSKLSD